MSIISEAMIATSSNITTHKKRKAVVIRRRTPKLPQTLQELVSKSTTTSIQNNKSINSPHSFEKLRQVKRSDDNNNRTEMMLLNPNINMNTISSDVTYNANAQGNVKRIRTPAPHDVLSGRGGSVNAHPGNCQFRDWVHVRKEEYNLARSKQAKADICREIIGKVLAIGGRFLTKENSNSQWWIEQDDERMMSKTSQALREGAPKIREAHREELGLKPDTPTSRRRANSTTKQTESNKRPIPSAASESLVNNNNNDNSRTNMKRVRVDYNGRTVFPNQSVTPPLTSSEEPPTVPSNFSLVPDETLTTPSPKEATTAMAIPKPILFPPPLSRTPITKPLADGETIRTDTGSEPVLFQRSHSLAASDIIVDENYEFVNPFDDESFLFDNSFTNAERTHSDATSSTTNSFGIFDTKMLKPGVIRETSMSSTSSDLAGYGALIGGSGGTMNANSSTNQLSYTYTPSPSTMTGAHIVPVRSSSIGSVSTADKEPTMNRVQQLDDDHEDDNHSISSAATIGLPLWDWFNRDESINRTVSAPTTKNVPNTTTPHEQHHHPIPISSQ